MLTIAELRSLAAKEIDNANKIQTGGGETGLSSEDLEKVKTHLAEHDRLQACADAQERLESTTTSLSQSSRGGPVVSDVKARFEDDPNRGFATPRHLLTAIIDATKTGKVPDNLRSLAIGSDEHSTADNVSAGFLIPGPLLQPGLLTIGSEADPTLGRTEDITMEAAKISFVAAVDKDHSTSVTGGLTVSRVDETGTVASSRLQTELINLDVHDLYGLAFATTNILTDSPTSFAQIVSSGFNREFSSAVFKEKLTGTGVGEFLGVLNSSAKIEVAKESGQSADTILGQNIINMRSRSWGYGDAIWIANHDTLPQLIVANIIITTAGIITLYRASEIDGSPDTLLGRPIFYSEHAETVGDVGDLTLVNWSQYFNGTLGTMQEETSIHVRFLNNEKAFKFWIRNDARPSWLTPLTPDNGATLSPIVTLAART